jgi:hypothetical protein
MNKKQTEIIEEENTPKFIIEYEYIDTFGNWVKGSHTCLTITEGRLKVASINKREMFRNPVLKKISRLKK